MLEECLRADVERVVHTSSVAAIGPAPNGGDGRRAPGCARGGLGIPYADAKHEAEVEALRIAARGLPVVVVCPAYVLGRGDLGRSSTELVRRFMLRRIPAYVDGAINVVDVEDVAAGMLLADARGVPGERYILGNRNYTWDRLFADLGAAVGDRAAGRAAAARRRRSRSPRRSGAPPGPTPITPVEVRSAAQWWTYRSTKARRELGLDDRARTRRRSRRPSPGTASARADGGEHRARRPRRRRPRHGRGARPGLGERARRHRRRRARGVRRRPVVVTMLPNGKVVRNAILDGGSRTRSPTARSSST